uniref:phosphoinositide 5-phosphatase n=1 Tax=Steinernema glaseri TaxID=37863 RepID=A0A1I7XYG1_9BILA
MSLRGFRVWAKNSKTEPYSVIVDSSSQSCSLLIESNAVITIDKETAEQAKRFYEKLTDGYGLIGILHTSRQEGYLGVITGAVTVGQLHGNDIYKVTSVQFLPLFCAPNEVNDARISDLQRLLSSGMFFFASCGDGQKLFDLTLCAQERNSHSTSDHRFFWNRNLHFPFEKYGIPADDWCLRCMSGSVLVKTVYVGQHVAKIALISRLSQERVGTRFNVRGVNDNGSVANFVETEQLILHDNRESSFVQIRGSVPLFWDQPGIQVGSHKVQLRAFEISAPAFGRHFDALRKQYGQVCAVNLLGSKEGERKLSQAFASAHKNGEATKQVPYIEFDYHAQMKVSKDSIRHLEKKLAAFMDSYSFFHANSSAAIRQQLGVIRTNCLDCLDRTNCVQSMIGLQVLKKQLEYVLDESTKANIFARFEDTAKDLWQKNGDQCSVIYAGTGALEGKSKLRDASRSLARTIQNNLMDSSKQESFDLLLHGCTFGDRQFERIASVFPQSVVQECPSAVDSLVERIPDMTVTEKLSLFVGTWNVNGGKNMYNVAFRGESALSLWLFPQGVVPYDIVCIGLEEIVDLSAGNIVKTSTTNQRIWCDGIRKTLIENTGIQYVLVGCDQLVGVCLYVFARPRLAPHIGGVSLDKVKTGMGGATGNKGSVALRMSVYTTSLCFVCSHFAAGQNEIKDRNEDFATALRKIRFSRGRDVSLHDLVFWLGDFNYRISLGGEEVKRSVRNGELDYLVQYDQLTQQKAVGNTFQDFSEGPLTFAPTYKYDTFSDDYDTSEKCRTPAWCDRILWRNSGSKNLVRLLKYDRAELKTSDHRPVFSIFELNALKLDAVRCRNVYKDVVECMGPPDGIVLYSIEGYPQFPSQIYSRISQKLQELCAPVLMSKIEGRHLWLVLENGEMALAALSLDGLKLAEGYILHAQLKTSDWSSLGNVEFPGSQDERGCDERKVASENVSLFNFDDDDDEPLAPVKSLVPPERPPAPVRSFANLQQAASTAPYSMPVDPLHSSSSQPCLFQNSIPVVPPRPSPLNWP